MFIGGCVAHRSNAWWLFLAGYTLCKFQIELAHSLPLGRDITPCALLVRLAGWKHFPTTSWRASGFTLGHRSHIMSADPKHEGFMGEIFQFLNESVSWTGILNAPCVFTVLTGCARPDQWCHQVVPVCHTKEREQHLLCSVWWQWSLYFHLEHFHLNFYFFFIFCLTRSLFSMIVNNLNQGSFSPRWNLGGSMLMYKCEIP